jgi:hypothetical protein
MIERRQIVELAARQKSDDNVLVTLVRTEGSSGVKVEQLY